MTVSGDSIVTAHIVASYLFAEPSAGDIDFGSGTQETVQVLVYAGEPGTGTAIPVPLLIAGGVSLTAVVGVLLLFLRRREQNHGFMG